VDGPPQSDGGEAGDAALAQSGRANRWFHVVVRQGRNRLVRRLWESQRCQVSRLIRVRYGPVELGRGIRSSGYRELEPREVRELLRSVGLDSR
jgi:23S rRNA pseudouridine2605 synthase